MNPPALPGTVDELRAAFLSPPKPPTTTKPRLAIPRARGRRLLTPQQASAEFGISQFVLIEACKRGEIWCIAPLRSDPGPGGKRWRLLADSVATWIEQRLVGPGQPLPSRREPTPRTWANGALKAARAATRRKSVAAP